MATRIARAINAPWALTTSVCVSSVKGRWLAEPASTATGRERKILWLRRPLDLGSTSGCSLAIRLTLGERRIADKCIHFLA
jgi:hypothetical protein